MTHWSLSNCILSLPPPSLSTFPVRFGDTSLSLFFLNSPISDQLNVATLAPVPAICPLCPCVTGPSELSDQKVRSVAWLTAADKVRFPGPDSSGPGTGLGAARPLASPEAQSLWGGGRLASETCLMTSRPSSPSKSTRVNPRCRPSSPSPDIDGEGEGIIEGHDHDHDAPLPNAPVQKRKGGRKPVRQLPVLTTASLPPNEA